MGSAHAAPSANVRKRPERLVWPKAGPSLAPRVCRIVFPNTGKQARGLNLRVSQPATSRLSSFPKTPESLGSAHAKPPRIERRKSAERRRQGRPRSPRLSSFPKTLESSASLSSLPTIHESCMGQGHRARCTKRPLESKRQALTAPSFPRRISLSIPSMPSPGQFGAAWAEPIGRDFGLPMTLNGPRSRAWSGPKLGRRPCAEAGAPSWQTAISTYGLGPCGPKPECSKNF